MVLYVRDLMNNYSEDRAQQETRAMVETLTPEYLAYLRSTMMTRNTEIYYGDRIPTGLQDEK